MKNKLVGIFKIIIPIIYIIGFILLLYLDFSFLITILNLTTSAMVLEYIKVLIWPSIVFLLIITFKSNFSGLLDRIAEFSLPGGVSGIVHPLVQQKLTTEVNTLEDTAQFKELLKDKIIEVTTVNTNLANELSIKEVELDFERIYNIIFASQIDLLLKMNNFSNVKFMYIEEHFNKVKQVSEVVFNDWNTMQYIYFLIDTKLIEYFSDSSLAQMTLKGKVFLQYLSARNYQKYGI